jgi:hypothetical protein
MSLDFCINARWVFSTVAEFHYFTTFTTCFSELEKLSLATVTVGFTFITARYTEPEVFARFSPSGSEGSEVVKPSLGCRRANSHGNSTVLPCLHEKARLVGGLRSPETPTRRASRLGNTVRGGGE